MSYAMYLRKSRADMEAEAHGEGETLSRHEKALTALAEKSGIEITRIYREIISGETIAARPEIQKLIFEVEQGAYEGVLVMDADRLARGDSVDQGLVARAFRLTGTKIITPRKVYDPNSEFDEEYFEFELFMARREYKLINRRIQRGRVASVNDGRYIASAAPYGYDRVKISGGKGYTIKPNKEADIVKYIFKQYLKCGGAGTVASALNVMEIPTRSGKSWSRATIAGILKNPVYIGKIRWSYRKNVKQSHSGQIVTKRKANDNCILAEGLHEPIIDRELFERVREKMSQNRKKPVSSSKALKNPFTGLLYCKLCGGRMTRMGNNSHTEYDVLKCADVNCRCVSSPLSTVEKAVLEALEQWFDGFEVTVEPKAEKSENPFENILGELSGELQKISDSREKICEFLEQGIYTAEIFAERWESLKSRENGILTKIKQLKEIAKNDKMSAVARENIKPQIKNLTEAYCCCENAEEKNSFLKAILGRAEYSKTVPNRRGHTDNSSITIKIYPTVEARGYKQ